MEFQVRDARITDVDRITTLLEMSGSVDGVPDTMADGAADLLRQMIYLPHAALLVADSNRRVVGFAVLALHPSIRRGGMVGTIDMLVVEPGPAEQAVSEALLSEAVRSARKKGCVVVEAAAPEGTMDQDRWEEQGFNSAGPRVECDLGRVRAAPR
ncbi:MAG: GNAT family N-acetyltransferase [Chloroflexi bacterium]|nr:GNAT family N-acetyltransferase [Chloroflexota bacterium]